MKNLPHHTLLANLVLVAAAGPPGLPASGMEYLNPVTLEQEYIQEQAAIDLVFAELMFKTVDGEIQQGEAQHGIDTWLHAHSARLTAQMERAAILDRIAPLVSEPEKPSERAINPTFRNADKARRYRALEWQELKAFAQCEQLAQSPQHRQELLDEWAHGREGQAILAEKKDLWIRFASDPPLGSAPVVLEVSEEAPIEEVEALDWRETSVRRVMDLRGANPKATTVEMQFLIDQHRQDFVGDELQITRLMEIVRHRELKANVLRLRAEVARSNPQTTSTAENGQGSTMSIGDGINNMGDEQMHRSGTP